MVLANDSTQHPNSSETESLKRKRDTRHVHVVGLEKIAESLQPFDIHIARAAEIAERDRARSMDNDSLAQSTTSIINAIRETKNMLSQYSHEEREIYEEVVSDLLNRLRNQNK